ncbi:cytochrome c551 [Bhargavaea cecembensis]|uniref:cytochrome c551 n=1 Tax=Bhargavaea cecembensis TaxID=394098 RepID=UPI000590577E|nr:cytochrome c [Bhargavaea cecembensis]
MKRKLMMLLFGSALVLGACGGNDDNADDNTTDTGNDNATEETTDNNTDTGGGETAGVDPEKVVQQKCISCHGENLEGQGNFPELDNVGSRLSEEEIHDTIENGRGGMPGGLIEGDELDAVAHWLSEKK